MSRYPSDSVRRFDQQFAETAGERNARFRKARQNKSQESPMTAQLPSILDLAREYSDRGATTGLERTFAKAVVKSHAALQQLLHECLQAGFGVANDYNWPKSIEDACAAIAEVETV